MSYTIRIESRDGNVDLVETSGDVPDGLYQVAGHRFNTDDQVSLTVRRLDGALVHHAATMRQDAEAAPPVPADAYRAGGPDVSGSPATPAEDAGRP